MTHIDWGKQKHSSSWRPSSPELGDRLRSEFVFVPCEACVRTGEAKMRVCARCRVIVLTLALPVVSCPTLFKTSLRGSGRGMRSGF